MRTKRLLAGTAAGVIATAVIAGCADQIKQLEPKLELRNAARHLADAQQAGFTLKLTGSADDLIAGLASEDLTADDKTSLRTLFDSSVTMAYDKPGKVSLAATVGGITGTEIRVIDQTVYAKAPITELATKFGASAADLDEFRTGAATEAPGVDALFDGKWVSVDLKAAVDSTTGVTDADPEKTLAEVRKSVQALADGATITRDKADADHLVVTTTTTKAYAEFKRLVDAVAGPNSDSLTGEAGEAPKDRPIVLDLWIDGGDLRAAELNLLQFADGATGRVALRVEVTTGAPIAVPEGATKIDPSALTGSVPAEAHDPVTLAEMLGYQAMEIAEDDGGKPADHLREAIGGLESAGVGATAKVVRPGVAQVTAGGKSACLKLPATAGKEPAVTAGAC